MTDHPYDGKHVYALVDAYGKILRTTEPLDRAPPPVYIAGIAQIWQQCIDDGPGVHAHNAHLFERCNPRFEMIGHRVHRIFEIRRKADAQT